MPPPIHARLARATWRALAPLVAVAFLTTACGSDSDAGSGGLPPSTTYAGFVATSVGQTGPLNLTFATPVAAPPGAQPTGTGPALANGAPVNVSGTMQVGGSPIITVEGTIDGEIFEALTDGGWTLAGTLEDGLLIGALDGPGTSSGFLVAASSSPGVPATGYCGTFLGEDTEAPDTGLIGTFSLTIAGGVIAGVMYRWPSMPPAPIYADTIAVHFAGTATPSDISVSQTDPYTQHLFTVDGTYDETGVSGSFHESKGEVPYSFGTFTGTPCG
ncbi:MAG TPA: hypothetical protein VFV65_04920 [Gemmatimonadales bacterium]|nr:hypothetical protein [Gemmatimonadales bacterium]